MSLTRYPCLAERVVIITGGASGIGEAFVRAFAANNARVAFLDRQADAGAALADAIEAETGTKPLFRACELLDITALRTALDEIHETLGAASVLVNNAANDQRQDLATVSPDEFDWSMNVNLKHVYFACQAVVPQMRALGGGSIINMSSVAWMVGGPDMGSVAALRHRADRVDAVG